MSFAGESERRCVLIIFGAKEGASNFGGIYNAVLSQIQALAAVNVEVIFWGASQSVADMALEVGATSAFADPSIHSGLKPLIDPSCWQTARDARRRGVTDVIHHSGRTWFYSSLFLPLAMQSQVLHRHRLGSYRFFRNWLALSKGYAAEIAKAHPLFGWRRVAFAPNGLRVDLPLPETAAALDDLSGPLKLVSLGRVGFQKAVFHSKGFDILIEAVALLKNRGVDVDLSIGGGADANLDAYAAEHDVADRVHLVGWIGDVASFMRGGDVFCLPSRIEPFGLVVIEAMAQGRAVIASRTHGPSDIVIDGESGLLTEVGSPKAMANAIESLAKDRDRLRKMGEASHQRIRTDYAPVAIGRALIAALEEFRRPRS